MECPISYLTEKLEELENWQNPKKYLIYEFFATDKRDPFANTYEVYNLNIEEEQGMVFADDSEEYIKNNKVWLTSFSLEELVYCSIHSSGEYITLTLSGQTYDGFIRIYLNR